MKAFSVLFIAVGVLSIPVCSAQDSPHWSRVPTADKTPPYDSFVAFDSMNLMFIPPDDAKIYYSSNRGVSWEYSVIPSLTYAHVAKVVNSTAILSDAVDLADYSSADMGRSWTRHPWAPSPAVIEGRHPFAKRWYDVGKGWYEVIKEIPRPFPVPDVGYYYLRQNQPFGPLEMVYARVQDALLTRLSFDAADSATYAFSGTQAKYIEGEKTSDWGNAPYGDLKYIGEKTWMIIDRTIAYVYSNTPLSEPLIVHLDHPILEIYSKDSVVIASYVDNYRGAYISKDLGRHWAEMQLHRTEVQHPGIPEFQIIDSLRIFMTYNDTVYYTSNGGGPTIPLASVAAARDAAPGVAVFGSVLTVEGGGEVEVLDLLGRRVVRAERSASDEPVKINLLPYPDGIYFVRSGKEFTKILWQRE